MTMPHLINCAHIGDGWCIECVKRQQERIWSLEAALGWYYEDDCRSTAMGILEHPFARPAAEMLRKTRPEAEADVEASKKEAA